MAEIWHFVKKFLFSLFVGPKGDPYKYVRPALPNQWKNIVAIWRNETVVTFGIERLFRLFLAITTYAFPGIYIRHVSGLKGLLSRKLSLEIYVTFKLFFPLIILSVGLAANPFVQIVIVYFGIETLLYVLGLLFLSDIYKPPISNKRSYLLVFMNYLELCFDFAVLYQGLNVVQDLKSSLDAVYFSFVTAFTVGYGDMHPNSDRGKLLVMGQCVSSLILITLVFAKVVAEFERNNASRSGTDNEGHR